MAVKATPRSLAVQGIVLSEQSRSPTSSPNPHRCVCFGGYCWRNLCHNKGSNGVPGFVPTASAVPEAKPKEFPDGLSVWRWDGSHEKGPLPAGRIPPRTTK